jgi:hypothetical protein
VIRLYDTAGNVIEMQKHKGDFKEPSLPQNSMVLAVVSGEALVWALFSASAMA